MVSDSVQKQIEAMSVEKLRVRLQSLQTEHDYIADMYQAISQELSKRGEAVPIELTTGDV